MADALYDIGIRLGIETSAFSAATREAVNLFTGLETAATRADTAVGRFAPRINTSFLTLQQSAQKVGVAYDRAAASMQAMGAQSGPVLLDEHMAKTATYAKNVDALTVAQGRLAVQQGKYNDLLARQKQAQEEAAAAQKRLNEAQQGANMILLGGVMSAEGAALRGFLGDAAKQATDLQTIMTQIGQTLTTSKTATTVAGLHLDPTTQAAAMAALQRQTLSIGEGVGMSQLSMAEVIRAATRAGMTQPDVLLGPNWQKGNMQGGILPGLATFSQLLNLSRGYTPEQSATVATEFAHLLGAWQPTLFNQMTDLLGRALMVSPATPEQFLTTSRQLATTIRPLYGNTEAGRQRLINDALTSTALEQEMGIGERGGTELARLITRTLGGNTTRSSVQNDALNKIERISGIQFFDAQGQFAGVAKVIEALAKVTATETPYDAEKLFQSAFMQVGGRHAGILSTPITLQRLKTLSSMFGPNGLPTTQAAMDQLLKTPQGQQYVAQQEWQNFEILIGTRIIPELSTMFSWFAKTLKVIVDIGNQFPWLADTVATFAGLAAVLTSIGGPLLVAWGTLKLITGTVGGIRDLTTAMRGLAVSEEAVAAAGDAAAAGEAAAAAGGAGGVGKVATAGRALAGFGTVGEAAAAGLAGASIGSIAVGTALFTAPAAVMVYSQTDAGRKQVHRAAGKVDDFIQHTPFGFLANAFDNSVFGGKRGIGNPVQSFIDFLTSYHGAKTGIPFAPAAPVQQHIGKVDIHIHPPAGSDAHKIAATTKAAIKQIGGGLAMDATYGSFGFTSNPTLRSGGW